MALLKESVNLLQAATFVNKWRHPEPNNHSFGLKNLWLYKAHGLLLAAIVILLITLINPLQAQAGKETSSSVDRERQLELLIKNGAYGVSGDHGLHGSANLDLSLIPASVIKILTGLVAFEELGPDYRFRTEFFIDADNNLYIKGYGDPFLISEEVEQIMISLKKSGCKTINDIYLDDSSHRLATMADGVGNSLNPYDVASSALAVNFNTINVRVDWNGTVHSGEPQTPLLPMMTRVAENLAPGLHRINVSLNQTDSLQLTGQLFRSFQKQAGLGGKGAIIRGRAPAGKPLYIHYSSKTLDELIEGLMRYSNNFIANQIFLQIGAKRFGYPATWEKGRRAVRDFIEKDPELAEAAIRIEEGSGLSRKNRLTVPAMLRILELFKPHARLLPEKDGVLLKSGTLTGVYSYAGYLRNNDKLDNFAIILNQGKNNRDEILKILRGIAESAEKWGVMTGSRSKMQD